jgi:hypothetical protein
LFNVAKDLTALGGKVCGPGPGVEPEQREGVEVGRDAAKLLTLGVGKVDKDAVLQAGKAQIDRLKAASQEIVLKVLHIIGSLLAGRVQTPGLGLAEKVVDELDKLAAGLGEFGKHGGEASKVKGKGQKSGSGNWDKEMKEFFMISPFNFFLCPFSLAGKRAAARLRLGTGPQRCRPCFQWRYVGPRDGRRFLRSQVPVGFGSVASGGWIGSGRRKASIRWALSR